MKKLWLAAVFLMLGLSSNAYSMGLENSGFEMGNTSGWSETYPEFGGRIDVVTEWSMDDAYYRPVGGEYFAVLESGGPDGDFTVLSQTVHLKGGDTLEGRATFCCGSEVGFPYAGDNGDYNDYAMINVLNGYNHVIDVPWYADSLDLHYGITTPDNQWTGEAMDFGPLPWEPWSWTAPAEDSYTLQYKTTQGGDSEWSSYAFFDTRAKRTAVPEPSLVLLLGTALAGLCGMKRFLKINGI